MSTTCASACSDLETPSILCGAYAWQDCRYLYRAMIVTLDNHARLVLQPATGSRLLHGNAETES